MDPIEVQFYHSIYLTIPGTSLDGFVRCFITAEVYPVPGGGGGFYDNAGQIQIFNIEIVDDEYSWLSVDDTDLCSREYDKVEERAYEIAISMLEYDSDMRH